MSFFFYLFPLDPDIISFAWLREWLYHFQNQLCLETIDESNVFDMGIIVAAVRGGVLGGVAGGTFGTAVGCFEGYTSPRDVIYCATGGTIGGTVGGAWVGIVDEVMLINGMTVNSFSDSKCH